MLIYTLKKSAAFGLPIIHFPNAMLDVLLYFPGVAILLGSRPPKPLLLLPLPLLLLPLPFLLLSPKRSPRLAGRGRFEGHRGRPVVGARTNANFEPLKQIIIFACDPSRGAKN